MGISCSFRHDLIITYFFLPFYMYITYVDVYLHGYCLVNLSYVCYVVLRPIQPCRDGTTTSVVSSRTKEVKKN